VEENMSNLVMRRYKEDYLATMAVERKKRSVDTFGGPPRRNIPQHDLGSNNYVDLPWCLLKLKQ
jgi:hypothetical protein